MTARIRPATDLIALADAAAVLQRGGLVAFPTETVYGLGADAFDARAVARVFEVKARPSFDPLIVHLAEAASLDWVAVADDARIEALAARFWPGPLTLVLRRRPELPDIVTAGLDTVGVRVPAHPAARALIAAAGTPLAAPSANPFGYVSPTTAAHVAELLGDAVELVLDGGPCRVGLESTILSLAGDPVILRPGGLPREALEDALGTRLAVAAPGERPLAPGQLQRHYATRTPLAILDQKAKAAPSGPERIGLLAQGPTHAPGFAAVEVLAPDGALETAAARLFAALRRLDAMGLDRILAEPCAETGLGHAIMDRLRRAAAREA
ncbi:MAG: L-threonylcarbamoyladenylate synthase [Burkholderiales bacterium]